MNKHHATLVRGRLHLQLALRLAKLLLTHCEPTVELCAFARALLTWVEQRGALQDLDLVLVWWNATVGPNAHYPLLPNAECEPSDAERIQATMGELLDVIKGPVRIAA